MINSYNSQTNFVDTASVVITASTAAPWRNYTAGLPWYGSQIQGELWLGNGTDQNLAWQIANVLAVLGPASTPADPYDPSQVQYPPCTSWVQSVDGSYYGAGNVTHPLRIWAGEPPSISFPLNEGLKTSAYSWKDLQVPAQSTAITALGMVGGRIVAHMNLGPPLILTRANTSEGGWKFDQVPLEANASAINPSCARDTKLAPFYLGSDLEIYSPKQSRAYDRIEWRDTDIVTDKSSGAWNCQVTKPATGNDYFIIYDQKNGRLWIWMQMLITGRNILSCYDQRAHAINGPWHYPDFLAVCQMTDDQSGCLVAGITRDGALLWADLGNVGRMPDENYSNPVGGNYNIFTAVPTISPGLPYVAVAANGQQFSEVLNGVTISLLSPYADWSTAKIVPAMYFMNAKISIVELSEAAFGMPNVAKEFINLRSLWKTNSRVYAAYFSKVNGYVYGMFRGLQYPNDSWENRIGGKGPTAKIRMIFITFNDQPARLMAIEPEFMPTVKN
jgi:hypothetical protein